MAMWIAALDTSSAYSYVALARLENSQIIEVIEERGSLSGGHQEEVALNFDRVCKSGGIASADLDFLTVGLGPGSFTGLRIGLSFMKGLALSLRRDLVGVPSFEAFVRGSDGVVACVADARRSEVFLGVYAIKQGRVVHTVRAPGLVIIDELPYKFQEHEVTSVVCPVGDPLWQDSRLKDRLRAPSAVGRGLVEGACQQLRHTPGTFDLQRVVQLEPYYVRPVAALTIDARKALQHRV